MLQLLTTYLFQYKKVSVPRVGTIQLIQHAPILHVVDKTLQPPSFSAELKKEEPISDHQLNFLAGCINSGKDIVLKELTCLGDELQAQINDNGFEWKGLGMISKRTHILPITITGFETIIAEKIIRQDSHHNILVGDKEMTSVQMAERRTIPNLVRKKVSLSIKIGWIILGLSVLAIAILLYRGKFKVDATGLKLSPITYLNKQANAL